LFTNLRASLPKRALNLAQPVCGSSVISTTASPTASRVPAEVLDAEVEIDVELVARERPALAAAGDEVGGAGVHQRQLGERVRRAVRPTARAAREPDIADEPELEVEHALVEHLALVLGRTADDQLDRSRRRG
jgi:hypothetical protein